MSDRHVFVVEQAEWYETGPELSAYATEEICRDHLAGIVSKPEWHETNIETWDSTTVVARWDNQTEKQYIKMHRVAIERGPHAKQRG